KLALQLRIEPGEAVPARTLGGVQSDVALVEHVLLTLEAADFGKADRGRNERLGRAEVDRDGQEVEQRPGDGFRFRMARAVKEDGELVAADAGAAGIVGRGFDDLLGDTP